MNAATRRAPRRGGPRISGAAVMVALVLGVWGAGCTIAPSQVARTEHCRVRAESRDEARRVADLAEDAWRQIHAVCPGLRDECVVIWVLDDFETRVREGVAGHHNELVLRSLFGDFEWRIVDRVELAVGTDPLIVTHEVLHFLLDRSWDPLPLYLEEGLADYFGIRADRADGPARRLEGLSCAMHAAGFRMPVSARGPDGAMIRFEFNWLGDYPPLETIHELFREEYGGDAAARDAAYFLGYALVSRIIARSDLAGLHALCRQTRAQGDDRISLPRILEAAGASDGDLVALLEEELTEDEFRELVLREVGGPGGPARFLVRLLRRRHPDASRHRLREIAGQWSVVIRSPRGRFTFRPSDDPRWGEALDGFTASLSETESPLSSDRRGAESPRE